MGRHVNRRNRGIILSKLSTEQIRNLLKQNQNSLKSLCRYAGRSQKHTRELLRARGISYTPDSRRPLLSSVPGSLLVRLYLEANENVGEVAKKFGVASRTVCNEFRRRGFTPKRGHRIILWSKPMLYRWYVDHQMTCAEIARRLGVCMTAVWKRLKKYGIPRRKRTSEDARLCALRLRRPFTVPPDAMLSVGEIAKRHVAEIMERGMA